MSNENLKENPYFGISNDLEDIKSEPYQMSEFEDEIVEYPWTFELVKKGNTANGNEIMELVPFFGIQEQAGTPINQRFLGNMDVAISRLYTWRDWVNSQILSLTLKGDATDGAILNGFLAIQFYASMKDLEGNIIILDGYYDPVRGELSV